MKDIPEDGRPRERFLKHGPETLSTAELQTIKFKNNNLLSLT